MGDPRQIAHLLRQGHEDKSVELEWPFCVEKPAGWAPFSDRFSRTEWMRWPWPALGDGGV